MILGKQYKYGVCLCGTPLHPVWVQEVEHKITKGKVQKTGRKRWVCSSLRCSHCFKNFVTDGRFDGVWE